MPLPTKNLPFEYTQRWQEVGKLLVPTATAETLNLLNKRDKDLEDYLANLESGGCCMDIFVGTGGTSSIAQSGSATADAISGGSGPGTITPTSGVPLQAGIWSVTGYLTVFPTDATVNGSVLVTASVFSAGRVRGIAYADNLAQDLNVPFSGIIEVSVPFTPGVYVINSLDSAISFSVLHYTAFRICDPCDYTVYTGK